MTPCASPCTAVDIQIRKCQPEDAAFLARSILIAGRAHVSRGIWEVVLNFSEEECLRFLEHILVSETPHLFHHTFYFIAETADGVPVGSLGGYDPKKSGYQALQPALIEVYKKLNLPGQSFQEANERAARILACLPRDIANAWVIDSVATIPEYRARGVAKQLLDAVMDEGRKQGYSLAQIVMYAGNEPAMHLYKKMGFTVIEETRDTFFEEKICSPGMLSLSRALW
jgi:ribosomal protein S18 acetylase RimI-like enzyme